MTEPIALAALTHIAPLPVVNMRVLWGVGVPIRAMGLDSLPIAHATVIGPSGILGMGNAFEMIGAYARTIAAKMVGLMALLKRAMKVLIKPTMCVKGAPRPISTAAYAEDAIAIGIDEGSPNPTRAQFWPLQGDRSVLVQLGP